MVNVNSRLLDVNSKHIMFLASNNECTMLLEHCWKPQEVSGVEPLEEEWRRLRCDEGIGHGPFRAQGAHGHWSKQWAGVA